ncbi:MAG: tRNA uridine(34) 5-carboxymethylaminomethyl modification radical SAM/GNAT enzyme Elp3 [Candidatus Njordarchaeota archaeon]
MIVQEIKNIDTIDPITLSKIKMEVAKKYGLKLIPRNHEIISRLRQINNLHIRIVSKPVRSISGIIVVSAFTKPAPCPGKCIYCPGGIKNPSPSPQSYSGHEPAARRAAELNFDPFLQVTHRVRQLEKLGHYTDKISLIIMGGTFLYLPKEFRDEFVKGLYEGILGERYPNHSLDDLQKKLESSKRRLVELTIETRPDYCFEKHLDDALRYGATRIEIGVQSLRNHVLEYIERGHDVDATIKAFRIAKDSGFKIVAHMMPNLPPDPDPERDYMDFLELFDNPDFRPDMLKIYPTAVVKGTKLYELWIKGRYVPYDEETLIDMLARVKKLVPPWIRIQRLQRDIPTYLVEAGYKSGNLRQLVQKYMKKHGWRCRCIRCREIGHRILKSKYEPKPENIKLIKRQYVASEGVEIFLSLEDIINDVVIGILRLRKPSDKAHRPEIDQNTTIIRELHVYGTLVPLGKKDVQGYQHKGYGRRLLLEAEKIALEEFDAKKMLIISGIGVREYYRKFGYRLEGPYMSKKLM